MSQVTIYLEKNQVAEIKRAARHSKKSVSKWVADAIQEKLVPQWPQEVIEAAGTWGDFPELSELRQTGQDGKRIRL